MPIPVECGSCQKRFKANEKLSGKKVKCPQCGGVIAIPAIEPAGKEAASMAGLLDREQVPVTAPAPKPTPVAAAVPTCPSCSAELMAGAVLCVSCGFDLRTGKQVARTAPTDGADSAQGKRGRKWGRKKKKGADTEEGETSVARAPGSFLLGCVLCVLGSSIGAGLWYGLVILTGYEIGWLAWGVGVLAGLGMLLGYRKENDLAGITAAFISCFGIVAAKWGVFVTLIRPHLQELIELEFIDESMSTLAIFNQTCFGLIDGIFILIAFFSAYKLGSGGGFGDA